MKKAKWVIVAIVFIIIIGAVAGKESGDEEPKKVGETSSSSTSDNSEKDEERKFKVGETAELNDVQVTMLDYKESKGGKYNKPSKGNVFVSAEFEIANNTDDELSVSSVMSFDAYADDYSLEYSLSAMMDEKEQLDGTVAKGKKLKGWIGWEVPKDYKNIEIHFTDSVWNDKNFIFVIEKKGNK